MQTISNSQLPVPNSRGPIFLVGMPAVGKTWWGERIAVAYGLAFTDLDGYIMEREKASIQALFAQYGEKGFREREAKYLNEITAGKADKTLVACGGGTPCYFNNMTEMKKAGCVVYLKAEIATLVNNITTSNDERPLLKGKADIVSYLDELLRKRSAFYEQAHFILQAEDISLATFAEIMTSCINRL